MTTLPWLPEARLRLNATAASASVNVESIAKAKLAAVQESREFDQLRPVRSHYEVRPFPCRLRGDRNEATAPRE
jgi:hypothetical protein